MQSGSGRQSQSGAAAAAVAVVAHVGFWVAFWVCGELWEVRLGSCVPRCNKQQKRKTVANIFEF